jgi:hypothetical protein
MIFHRIHINGLYKENADDKCKVILVRHRTSSKAMSIYILPTSTNSYITLDFATAASQNAVRITQKLCHIMILFHDFSIITDESDKKNPTF